MCHAYEYTASCFCASDSYGKGSQWLNINVQQKCTIKESLKFLNKNCQKHPKKNSS